MYAQLCKRLSEEAPNFEPPGQPCTFKLLLLNKCRTEFENRAQAFAAFDDRQLPPEDEERRHLAKCKMLGNIKFIGELGKLEILAESILHRCIQNLLARRAAAEHHEDLECLAQLVRTCGRVLDSERGRGLMEQYFARIDTLASSRELAPRIRFMLRDVVELRRGGWVPRAANAPEGPVPIQQLRGDEEPPPRRDLFRAPARRPLDDVLAGLSLAPPTAPQPDKLFPNGFGSRDAYRQRSAQGYFPRYNKAGSKQEPAPRPHKSRLAAAAALEDVQMRPGAYSLMYTANRLSKPQPTPLPLAPMQQNVLTPAFSTAPLIKEPAITIKPAPDKKDKPKKDKGVSKEEACRVAIEALEQLTRELEANGEPSDEPREPTDEPGDNDTDEPGEHVRRLQDLQLPDKLLRRVVAAILEHALRLESGCALAAACLLVRGVKRASLQEPLRALLAARGAGLAPLLARLVRARLVPLADVAALCDAPLHATLLLDTLQHLGQLVPPSTLQDLYNESKINLCQLVSAEGEGSEAALEALERRGLDALEPQLRVQAQLQRQLAAEPQPHLLYRWIKTNVDASVRNKSAFVSTLVGLVAAHVTAAAGAGAGAGAGAAADKAALEREKALFAAYAPLLTALLQARSELQLAAVYAVQLHAHRQRYPKGLLLRWFMYLYNLEVCEEDAFLRWREDVTDHYPGKGEALFQVNAWLTWLQQQESEEEEAED